MQHHPHRILLIEAKLDEVIAGAERSEMSRRALCGLCDLGMLVGDDRQTRTEVAGVEVAHRIGDGVGPIMPSATVAFATGIGTPMRHRLFDRGTAARQIVWKMVSPGR